MGINIPSEVLTLGEVAALLRATEETIVNEVQNGALSSFTVGGELRFLRQDIEDYVERARQHPAGAALTKTNGSATQHKRFELKLSPGKPFSYIWPHKKTETAEDSTEHFDKVLEGTARLKNDVRHLKIGYTSRRSAGMERRRAILFVDKRPLVEFAAGNDFDKTRLMASLIRRDRRQVRTMEAIPPGYNDLRIEPYNEIVRGPRASHNLALVCKADDHDAMARHALVRAQQIEARPKTN